MSAQAAARSVGELLRDCRVRQRRSQLDLALDAEVSTRHLSFVETGRSRPSRELLLRLAEHLEIPLRERNTLLLAAGYAPAYTESPLDSEPMAPVRAALDRILAAHEPFPAVVVDQRWELVAGNRPAIAILADGVAPELLTPPVNTLRVSLHPQGLAPRIVNLAEYSAHLLIRLHRQQLLSGDPVLAALHDELRGYPGVDASAHPHPDLASMLVMPLRLRSGGAELTLFSTLTTFGTALDITVAELMVEAFFPADAATEAALR